MSKRNVKTLQELKKDLQNRIRRAKKENKKARSLEENCEKLRQELRRQKSMRQ